MREALTPAAQSLRDLRQSIEDLLDRVDLMIRRRDALDDEQLNSDLDELRR